MPSPPTPSQPTATAVNRPAQLYFPPAPVNASCAPVRLHKRLLSAEIAVRSLSASMFSPRQKDHTSQRIARSTTAPTPIPTSAPVYGPEKTGPAAITDVAVAVTALNPVPALAQLLAVLVEVEVATDGFISCCCWLSRFRNRVSVDCHRT